MNLDLTAATTTSNVARRLTLWAARMPQAVAVAEPRAYDAAGRRQYLRLSFAELDAESTRLAAGLQRWGVAPGTRLALLVPPSLEFVTLVFALLKAGAVTILIDPGMGRRNLVACLAEAEPRGFVGVRRAQWARWLFRRRFPLARWNVLVGGGPGFGAAPLASVRELGEAGAASFQPPVAAASDPAAVIFTTGSTGPPKGVLYTHGTFDRQVDELQQFYGIAPGEVDLPGFPLFGLFNSAMGVTTVIPDMDPTRPARVDPAKFVEAVRDWQVTQSFGSPAIWNRVGAYCQARQIRLDSLRRVMSAGAPVPTRVLATMHGCLGPGAEMHTPYGATEALPIASISAREVLAQTSARTRQGGGVCVGRRFPGVQWQVIRAEDRPLPSLCEVVPLSVGEIGELIVSGAVVTREYVTRREANAASKIDGGQAVWHRMGDVGYLDEQDRFWFCGRMAHRVLTAAGPLYTICCEAIFNEHAAVFRSALVGIGPAGAQRAAIVVEPWQQRRPRGRAARQRLRGELRELALANPLTESVRDFLICRAMPVDIRHNAKIFREQLATWAARRLR